MKLGNLVLATLAGTAVSTTALAQSEIPAAPFGGTVILNPVGVNTPPFASRAIENIYDNQSNAFGGAAQLVVLGAKNVVDDATFAPGPWAGQTNRLITEMVWLVQLSTGCTANQLAPTFDVLFDFYTGADFTATDMLGAATNIGQARFTVTQNCGFIWAFTSSLAGLPGGGIAVPDGNDTIFIRQRFVETGTENLLPGAQYTWPVWGTEPSTRVGATVSGYGRDIDASNSFLGGTPVITGGGAGAHEHRQVNEGAPVRGIVIRLRGDVPPPPPPSGTNLGALNDGVTNASGNVGAGQVQWFQFFMNGNAQDLEQKFFDVDSEGSTGDVSLALYNEAAQLVMTDNDSGSGTNDQLTFGVGRRAAVGDGQQYDGRHGQLLAGTYYLAVAPAGSTFSGAYAVTPSQNPGGDFAVHFNTNNNAGALDPSVTPIVGHDYDALGGPIGFPDARQGLNVGTGLRGVQWSHFSLSAEAGSGTSFLDMDFALTSTPSADGVAYIFDANGEMVAFSDDEGLNALPMFSFGVGDGTPRFYDVNPEPYTGQTPGTLPAGDYYVAMALYATQDITLLGVNDRWHVRGTSGSNLTVTGDIYTGGAPGGACDPDVNCDGVPDQGDVACIILAVAGDMGCFCQADPDFNRDGVPDQGDVEAVILSVAGAPCP